MEKNKVLKKNTITNTYELNLPDSVGTKECINILNSELLQINRDIYDLEMKKQTVLEIIDQKNRQRRKEDEEYEQLQERKNKIDYLNKIKPIPNYEQQQEELRTSKNKIYEHGSNLSQVNNSSFKMNQNISQMQITKSQFMEVENENEIKQEDSNNSYISQNNSQNYLNEQNNSNNYIDSNYKQMNFNTDMNNQSLFDHQLNNQNYSSLQNNNSSSLNYSQILNKKKSDKKNEEDKLRISQIEEQKFQSQKNKQQELEKAMQSYFDVKDQTLELLRNVDSLDDSKVTELAQQFGLKTGKDKLKQTKQALKDIHWFLKRNKMPQTYLVNYKPEIQEKVVSIPEDQLIQFQYKH